MIFVTIGTHPGQFVRLVKKIDEIAPLIKEKIIIQTGFTTYKPKNVTHFAFADDLAPYFKEARIVVSHSATSLLEFVLTNKKPVITVPRQARYGEHVNDHQVEFAEALEAQTGIKAVYDIEEVTASLLSSYSYIPHTNKKNLMHLRSFIKKTLLEYDALFFPELPLPYASSRLEYLYNSVKVHNAMRILNIGIANIPEWEMRLEQEGAESLTLDNDRVKNKHAQTFLRKARVRTADIYTAPLKEKHYDVIVLLEVFEHLPNDEVIMQKLVRALKPGGRIVFSVPSKHWLHLINPVKYTQHYRHYTKQEAESLAKKAGLHIIHSNEVENWTLLANLYLHLVRKYLLRSPGAFTFFTSGEKTYRQQNVSGLDIWIVAQKKK